MKKYSLIIVLCLCLVVGGVFATWTYAETTATPKELANGASFAVEGKTNNVRGTITVSGAASFKIDQSSEGYDAVLVADASSIHVDWQAAQGTSNAANLVWEISGALTVDGQTVVEAIAGTTAVPGSGDISASDVLAKLQINLTLDTVAKHTKFVSDLSGNSSNTLVITVSEAA